MKACSGMSDSPFNCQFGRLKYSVVPVLKMMKFLAVDMN